MSVEKRTAGLLVLLIFTVALFARVVPIVSQPETHRFGLGLFSDSVSYHNIAHNLALGNGFSSTPEGAPSIEPSFSRAPGYPFLMSIAYRLLIPVHNTLGVPVWPTIWQDVRILQAVLDATTCVLVFLITRLIFPASRVPALLACLLVALCPYTIFYTRIILRESLITFVLTSTLLACILAMRYQKLRYFFAGGVGLGATILCAPQFMLAPLFLGAGFAVVNRAAGLRTMLPVCLFVASAVATVAPWTARNYLQSGAFVPVAEAGLGVSLFWGSFESYRNWIDWRTVPAEIFETDAEMHRILNAYVEQRARFLFGQLGVRDADAQLRRFALERLHRVPAEVLASWAESIPRLWYQYYIPFYADKEASGHYFKAYFVLLAIGVIAFLRPCGATMMPVLVIFLYLNAIYLPLHVEPRYGVPMIPSLLSLSGLGAYWMLAGLARWRRVRSWLER